MAHLGKFHNPAMGGFWVLEQSDSSADLTNFTARIQAGLDAPYVRGFSGRYPWKLLETARNTYDFSILDQAKAVADSRGKMFVPRFMAGFRIPDYLFDTDGMRYYSAVDGNPYQGGTGNSGIADLTTIGTLHTTINNSVTAMDIDEVGGVAIPELPFGVKMDAERMQVTDRVLVSGSRYTYTIVRAYQASSAASHSSPSDCLVPRMPDPCNADGSVNTAFADRWEALLSNLVDWAHRQKPKPPMIHLVWHGYLWSEIYNESPLKPVDGRPGYSTVADTSPSTSQELIDAHTDLIVRASRYNFVSGASSSNVDIDFAFEGSNSGHGASGQILTDIQSQIRGVYGNSTPQFYIQANNVDDGAFSTGAPADSSKGLQLVSSDSNYNQASWEDVVMDTLVGGKLHDYLEVYCSGPSLGNTDWDDANSVYLRALVRHHWYRMRPHKQRLLVRVM